MGYNQRTPILKHCNGCGQDKEFESFYKKPRFDTYKGISGYSHQCKECDKKARAEYVANNPDKCKNSDRAYRLNKYGLSTHDYNELFAAQAGKCLGCDRHQSELKKRLVVDHCHSSGRVRGLLCIPCNLILGYAHDDPGTLHNLIKYLQNPELADINSNVVSITAAKKVG